MFFLVDGSVNATDTVVEGRDFEDLSGKLSEGCRITVMETVESGPGQRVCAAQEMGQQNHGLATLKSSDIKDAGRR